MTEAYVALTAPSLEALGRAFAALDDLPASELAGASGAVALEGEEAGALVCVRTTFMPAEFVELAREALADVLEGAPCACDLLLFGEDEWVAGGVPVPHPRLLATTWWVDGLTAAWPDLRMPNGSRVIGEAADSSTRAVRSLGPVPGFASLTLGASDATQPAEDDAAPAESCSTGSCSSCGTKQVAEFCGAVVEDPEDWVVIAAAASPDLSPFTEEALELSFLETVLRDAGIETAWYPHRPGDLYTQPPVMTDALSQLLVQPWRADEARALLAEATSAEPEGEWWAEDWNEDASERPA